MGENNAPVASTSEDNGGPSNGNSGPKSFESRSESQRGNRFQGGRGRGGRGGRGRGQSRGNNKGFGSGDRDFQKKGDMGRSEYNRKNVDKRQRNQSSRDSRAQKTNEDGTVAESEGPFSKDEINAEARQPKRKVAVMIGYAGSGYKGMQINGAEKTIEGDLFKAFVAAGAISKANADDPKKSSLVRCARTDKGVHAAGNVISLKLIVEDPNIVKVINENLPPQIRVWGMERTNGSFSCYQTCDSRWYEYLIPTYSFLLPHPQSFLGKKLVESAEEAGIVEILKARQEDVASFWEDAEEAYVKPILDKLDPELRANVMAAIHMEQEESLDRRLKKDGLDQVEEPAQDGALKRKRKDTEDEPGVESEPKKIQYDISQDASEGKTPAVDPAMVEATTDEGVETSAATEEVEIKDAAVEEQLAAPVELSKSVLTPLESAVKQVKAAYIQAKKAYRISDSRRKRVQEALNAYEGTRNFHNYTIQKSFKDPSAKRVIRSFKVGPEPVIINDTEWLSLKVHGQSFMMHQIRKMVAMVALIVRCASPISLIQDSYGPTNISIPKAPGLGLLLERPVFDSYNERAVREFSREKIDFDNYSKEMLEFKQREIYDRIFREEEKDHQFHTFFHHIDSFQAEHFLWVTALGIAAAKNSMKRKYEDEDEEVDANGEEG